MTRSVLLLSLAAALSFTSAASAQQQAQAQEQEQAQTALTTSEASGAKTALTGDPNRRICKTIKVTGTRLGKSKVCRSAVEWSEQTAQNRQGLERAQTQAGLKGN